METLQLTATAIDGKLLVAVPETYNNKPLEITVRVKEEGVHSVELTEELKRKRMEDFGKAPFPDFPIDKYDVYNQ